MIYDVDLNPVRAKGSFTVMANMFVAICIIGTDAADSGVAHDIFTFKQLLCTVATFIATLCASVIDFESSRVYQIPCFWKNASGIFDAIASISIFAIIVKNV